MTRDTNAQVGRSNVVGIFVEGVRLSLVCSYVIDLCMLTCSRRYFSRRPWAERSAMWMNICMQFRTEFGAQTTNGKRKHRTRPFAPFRFRTSASLFEPSISLVHDHSNLRNPKRTLFHVEPLRGARFERASVGVRTVTMYSYLGSLHDRNACWSAHRIMCAPYQLISPGTCLLGPGLCCVA